MSDHYFSADPGSAEKRVTVVAGVWGRELRLQSASGVFAHGRLDIGTSVLFRATPPPVEPGTFLDLGCGYGVIGCALASAVPTSLVWAVDLNERALRLTSDNAAALGLADRVTPALPEQVPDGLVFDEIWSNPPIRIGKPALHELLSMWLPRLAPDGRAVLVVGKNLGADSLQRWIGEQGYRCDRLASAKGFRVLEVRPRDPQR
ncbi:MAG: methyltransferase [Nocardioidaceae bacterium]|nr:methyltransferase [Nocardioidaceae bacterium]